MENKKSTVRALALDVLTRCESGGYSNIALDTVIKRNDLTPSDRAFITALIYGVIERKITLDYIISSLSSIPIAKKRNAITFPLRTMGAIASKIPNGQIYVSSCLVCCATKR